MRVLVVFFFAALITVADPEGIPATPGNDFQSSLNQPSELNATFIAFWKRKRKKKLKTSSRMKKSNKRMGKNFKRKNDDSLRRD